MQRDDNQNTKTSPRSRQEIPERIPGKKTYARPILTDFGDVRDLTLGGSGLVAESTPGTFFPI
jgi:hypothetical protein